MNCWWLWQPYSFHCVLWTLWGHCLNTLCSNKAKTSQQDTFFWLGVEDVIGSRWCQNEIYHYHCCDLHIFVTCHHCWLSMFCRQLLIRKFQKGFNISIVLLYTLLQNSLDYSPLRTIFWWRCVSLGYKVNVLVSQAFFHKVLRDWHPGLFSILLTSSRIQSYRWGFYL